VLDQKTKQKAGSRIAKIVGHEHITEQKTDRILNAHDAWPLSLAKIRAGELLPLADFVVFPGNTDEISKVLVIANELKIPVVPVGGGAGTCGGTVPIYGGIQLDLKRLDKICEIDHASMTVRVQAGVTGIDLEEEVNRHGYTTGHTPTSSRASNIGGFIATRSGGSMSSLYGKIEDLTLGLQVVLANGSVVDTKAVPRHSVGPDLRELFVGSEGTLGVITPSIVRLYDPEDAAYSFSMRFEFEEGHCILLLAFDGDLKKVEIDEARSLELCVAEGGTDLGEEPSQRWWDHRFDMYYPSPLTTSGYTITDTIDIVATYDKLENVYHAMKKAMEAYDAIVISHFSHMYQNGGSIYMIFYTSQPDAQTAWDIYKKIWDDGVAACLQEGGTMSHQHGVGLTRSTYTKDELGSGFIVLKKIKETLDPNGIMNPGKLGLGVRE
jgi:alkyldihydroxyacetonephosphate synthase